MDKVGWGFLLLCLGLLPGAFAQDREESLKNGQALYLERCVLCHGASGEGWDWSKKMARPPVPVPNLVEVVPQRSEEYLLKVIREGGAAVGLTSFMPAFGFDMSEQDLKDVVAYLRSFSSTAR